jgi:response regulator RpfG family c-di-GMP phosphodiesterase
MSEKKNVTILYVDDEESNLFLFKNIFKRKYNVITAISGMEGLKKLEDYQEDIIVVISDMRMPNMNGLEFIETARKTYKNIAYYILTGYAFSEDIESALENDVIQKFFTKPFDYKEIDAAIQESLKQFGR